MGFASKFEFPQKALPYQMEMNDCCNFKKNDVFYYRGLNTFFFKSQIEFRVGELKLQLVSLIFFPIFQPTEKCIDWIE